MSTSEAIRERLFNGLPEQPLPSTLFDDALKEVLDNLECTSYPLFVESFFTATAALSCPEVQHHNTTPVLAPKKLTFSDEDLSHYTKQQPQQPQMSTIYEEETKEKDVVGEKSSERVGGVPKSDPIAVPLVNVIQSSTELEVAHGSPASPRQPPLTPHGPVKSAVHQFTTRPTRSNSMPDPPINLNFSSPAVLESKVSPRRNEFSLSPPAAVTPPSQVRRKLSLGSSGDSVGGGTLEFLNKAWQYKVPYPLFRNIRLQECQKCTKRLKLAYFK